MTESAITTSGGLLTSQFIENLRQPVFQHPGLRPETFALPGRMTPSPKELEENLAVTWELLKERYDTVHLNLRNLDVSEVRSRWLLPLFSALDFEPEFQKSHLQIGEDEHLRFGLSHKGWKGIHAPILHMVAPSQPLDERAGQQRGNKSPHDTLQQYLNLTKDHLWSVVTNGLVLRILRDYHHTYTKGFIEFDLESIFYGRNYGDFRCLYRMLHMSRFIPGEDGKSPLESFYDTSLTTGVAVGTDLRGNVVEAIEVLGNGFLEGSSSPSSFRDEKRAYELYAEILHVVYRTLFLLFAEQRGMLGRRHSLYAEEYSITALRTLAEGEFSREERHTDLWERLKVTFKMVKGGVPEMDIFGYNGALFDEEKTRHLNGFTCRNGALLEAVRLLTCVEKDHVLTRISYADLGVEEIGSIYESLLDYTPRVTGETVTLDKRILQPGTFLLDPRSAARKSSGSYYTNPKLVNELIRSALLPVVWSKLKDAGLPVRPESEIGKDNLGLLKDYANLTPQQRELGEKVILRLKVVDAATGSAAFLIAADNTLGLELSRIRTGQDCPTENEMRKARRDVLMHCLYGVDLNPMAVELAKVSLWINACVDNQPLNFLDHRIRCGNSLIGIPTRTQRHLAQSLIFKEKEELQLRSKELTENITALLQKGTRKTDPDIKALVKERDKAKKDAEKLRYVGWADAIPEGAFNPVTGDDPDVAKAAKKRNREELEGIRKLSGSEGEYHPAPALVHVAESIDTLTENLGTDVEAKKRTFREFRESEEYLRNKRIADLWTAAFFQPLMEENEPNLITTGVFRDARQNPDAIPPKIMEQVQRLSDQYHFFHWELEFPEVFERDEGGFDVVLGNPPWERIKLQEKEFFAARDDSIAEASNASARKRMIEALLENNPALYQEFQNSLRASEAESKFLRNSERFPLTAMGDVNTYMVFSGQFEGLLSAGGRAGVIVPSGIATDDTTKEFFQHLMEERLLVSLHSFFEIRKLFPDTDSRNPFCLLTIAGKATIEQFRADFIFNAKTIDELQNQERHFGLSKEDLFRLNPNTRTCPTFRSQRDAEIAKDIYTRFSILKNDTMPGEQGNPWGVRFLRMFDMSNDSHLFRTKEQLETDDWILGSDGNFEKGEEKYLRLYEAKMMHHFDHRFGSYASRGEDSENTSLPTPSVEEYANPNTVAIPRYWVKERDVLLIVADVPQGAKDALRAQNEEMASNMMAFWLAGYHLNHGKEELGGEVLMRVTGAVFKTMVSAMGDYLTARGMESQYPITQNDIESIKGSGTVLEMLEKVVSNHFQKWFMAFRDIARSTDERTAIFSVLPWCAVGHKAPCIRLNMSSKLQLISLAQMNSSVFDYCARQKVGGTSLGYFILKQIPIISLTNLESTRICEEDPISFLAPRALELVYTAHDLTPFARDCGYEGQPFRWDEERRFHLRCSLDAIFFHLYGINRDDTNYIMDTFPIVKRKDEAKHGSYRTKETILRYYDAIAEGKLDLLPPVAPELKDWKPPLEKP